ncbi:hypothetical protein [Glycomyces terrestris]|uniref:Uncharacterized protein n=1 Tax=Glycomyces terrestris TaxID=2493553 RepID=A0A426V0Y6_9ACTN|nr:hypothetical protein [Glycomyces terrestris]RRS00497.1 hypothetical protein EIW28_08015 [Glycomyces terrestris]
MNPDQASAKGGLTIDSADRFGALKGELLGIVNQCVAAAGEPEVVEGYDEFGATWSTDLAKTADHGVSVGGTTHATVGEGVGTDTDNAGLQSVDAPLPSAPSIKPV